ncbi:FecCD family ABC transporter permease [Bordetella tumbae]|uniref:FecCD family ABC transporter permease n=1 Tax=Bordetella tumbae TaxID=1649139 RepID=UPI0039EEB15A
MVPTKSTMPLKALGVSALCLLLLCLLSLLVGAGDVGPADSLRALLGGGTDNARFTVLQLRWTRTELALLVGVSLGVAGLLMQAVTRNPLAEPGLLGVSAGSSFAVVLAILLGASAAATYLSAAFIGAMAGCMLVMVVMRMRGVGDDPIRLVLAGAAFTGLLQAGSSMILLSDQRTADEIRFWVVGGVAGRPLETFSWTLPGLILGLLIALPLIRPLAALALGEHVAKGLGHHPHVVRLATLLSVALLVGTANAAAGPIAFLGLIVPYIARRLVGTDIRKLLGLCVLLGPCVLLLADIVSRVAVRPYELPVGVLTAFIGAPILIAVVRGHRLPGL